MIWRKDCGKIASWKKSRDGVFGVAARAEAGTEGGRNVCGYGASPGRVLPISNRIEKGKEPAR